MDSLYDALKRRRIVPWVLTYAAGAWVVLQVLAFLSDQFSWHASLVPAATIFAGIGVLAALVLAWYHGERGRQRPTAGEVVLLAAIFAGASGAALATASSRDTVAHPAGEASANSIAVLPFVNVSGAPADEYFSDGITEEIMNALSRVEGLDVAARTSSFGFKGKMVDIREIARALRVVHVLEGTVQRAGSRVRINAKLVNATTGYDLWSQRFESEGSDLFSIEDSISNAIARELELRLNPVGARVPTLNMNAHDLYLIGLDRFRRRTDLQGAVRHFEQAIAADTGYADAYAGLALVMSVLANYDDDLDPEVTLRQAAAAAKKALERNPASPEAHAALAQVALFQDSMRAAALHAREAIRLNPSYATAHQWLAEGLGYSGDNNGALTSIERALQLDPLSPVINYIHGRILANLGRYEEAIAAYRQTQALDPDHSGAFRNMAAVALIARKYDVASQQFAGVVRMRVDGFDDAAAVASVNALADPPRGTELDSLLRKLPTTNTAGSRYWAILLNELAGNREKALAVARVEAAGAQFNWGIVSLMSIPAMKSLRDDPRFPERLRWPRK